MGFFKKKKKKSVALKIKDVTPKNYNKDVKRVRDKFNTEVYTVTVYYIGLFTTVLNKKHIPSLFRLSAEIYLKRDGKVIIVNRKYDITICNNMLELEAEYLEKKLSSKELNVSAMIISYSNKKDFVFPTHKPGNEFINIHGLSKTTGLFYLKIIDCVTFDSLIYIKDAYRFKSITIKNSSFKRFKNIPKWMKFKSLKNLILDEVSFENRSLEFSFFNACQDLEKLTKFSIDKRKRDEPICGFNGYISNSERAANKLNCVIFWGLFATKEECQFSNFRNNVHDRCSMMNLLQQFKNLEVKINYLTLGKFGTSWQKRISSKYFHSK